MENIANRLEFAPPRDKGSLRAFALALLVHVLLIAALTWGVNWKRSDEAASFEAELWSGATQPAAPRRSEVPPTPPAPAPAPVPAPPAPPPPPVSRAPEVTETPPLPDADIALEREKKRKLLRQQKEAEIRQAQKLREQRDAELQARREKELAERQAQALVQKAEAKKQAARELALEKEKERRTAVANAAAAAEKQRQAAVAAATAEKQKALAAATAAANAEKQKLAAAAAAKQKQAAEAAAASEKQRQAAIQQRIMGMAGAAASPGSGSAKAAGPSAGYAGKVVAKVLPNVVFTDEISGNPRAEVEVSTTSDGTIMSQRLRKSSGNKAWDEAVIKAIIRTGSLPRDVDGRVPTPMIIEFKPN